MTGAGDPSAVITIGGLCWASTSRSPASRGLELWVTRFRAHGATGVDGLVAAASWTPAAMVVIHASRSSLVRQLGEGNAPTTPERAAATTSSGPDTRNIGADTIGRRVGNGKRDVMGSLCLYSGPACSSLTLKYEGSAKP